MKILLQASSLDDSLNRELKARGITFTDLASRINMSGTSVKRMFSKTTFQLQRMDEVLQATRIDFQDIALAGHDEPHLISELTYLQEKEIFGDTKLFIVAVSVLNQLSLGRTTASSSWSRAPSAGFPTGRYRRVSANRHTATTSIRNSTATMNCCAS